MECSCIMAGFCPRHEGTLLENKDERRFKLCQTRPDYRELWDKQAFNAKKGIYEWSYDHNLSKFTEQEKKELRKIKNKWGDLDLYLTIVGQPSIKMNKNEDFVYNIDDIKFYLSGPILKIGGVFYDGVFVEKPFVFKTRIEDKIYMVSE